MKKSTFEQMLDDLIKQEEKKLGLNSPEFNQKHLEIMEMIEAARKKE